LNRIGVEAAGDVLREGGVVLLDTDTLPGLHGLATVEGVAGQIAALKGHPPERPYLLLVPSLDAALHLGEPAGEADRALLASVWPGELTALLRPQEGLAAAWTDRGRTVGVRVPAAGPLRDFLATLPGPLFSTSANLAGQEPARTLEEAEERFPGLPSVDLGIQPRQGASTIVDFSVSPPRLVRPGIVPFGS
jgi:L-threonylcarbamoyladenylate synthase